MCIYIQSLSLLGIQLCAMYVYIHVQSQSLLAIQLCAMCVYIHTVSELVRYTAGYQVPTSASFFL